MTISASTDVQLWRSITQQNSCKDIELQFYCSRRYKKMNKWFSQLASSLNIYHDLIIC